MAEAYTAEQFNKLPKWAQRRIEVLERELEHWKRQATEVSEHESDISLGLSLTTLESEKKYIPSNSHIYFKMGAHWGDFITVYLKEIYVNGMNKVKSLQIMAGSNALHVMPQASNSVNVYQDYPILRNQDDKEKKKC